MFDPAVFAARREAFMQAIGTKAVAIVRSLPERLRNGDAFHPFRQHSDVLYLTGFVEPETTLVLRPGAETERVIMFVRPRDPEMETWDGRRAGLDGQARARGKVHEQGGQVDAATPCLGLGTASARVQVAQHTDGVVQSVCARDSQAPFT